MVTKKNRCLVMVIVAVLCHAVCLFAGIVSAGDTLRLTLKEVNSSVLSGNLGLKGLKEAIMGDSASLRANELELLPRLDIQAGYTYLDQVQPFKAALIGEHGHDFMVTLRAQHEIYDGGRKRAAIESARAAFERSTLERDAQFRDILLSSTRHYLQLQIWRERIRILDQSRIRLDEQIRYARLLSQAGRISALEEQRFLVEMADLDSRMESFRGTYLSHSRQLFFLMGRTDLSGVIVPADSLVRDPAADAALREDVSPTDNPEVLALEAQIRSFEANKKSVVSAGRPRVTTFAWYGYEFGTAGFSLVEHDRYSVGALVAFPILDRRRVSARAGAIDYRIEQVKLSKEQKILHLELLVIEARTKINELRRTIDLREKAVELAGQNVRMADLEFRAGRRSATDMIDMNHRLLQAELDLTELFAQYNGAVAAFRHAAGLIGQMHSD